MSHELLFSLSAIIALIPAAFVSRRKEPARDMLFWAAVIVGIAGPLSWVVAQITGGWHPELSTALWVNVTTSMILFSAVAAFSREGWRLCALFAPYMILVAVLAFVWQQEPGQTVTSEAPSGWIKTHIILSVLTYALVTMAAIASFAAFLQETALKTKTPTNLTKLLPSVADCESLTVRLLFLGALVLGFGLMTGMASQYGESGQFLKIDHKSILTIASFLVILGLLFAHFRSGVRGRVAARFVLVAYLLLTLGYPGVKFVTEIIIK